MLHNRSIYTLYSNTLKNVLTGIQIFALIDRVFHVTFIINPLNNIATQPFLSLDVFLYHKHCFFVHYRKSIHQKLTDLFLEESAKETDESVRFFD